MTDTERLSLALAAIEAGKKLVPRMMNNESVAHINWCYVCMRRIEGEWPHSKTCELGQFLELVTKLEAAK